MRILWLLICWGAFPVVLPAQMTLERNLFLHQAFSNVASQVAPSVVEIYHQGCRLGFGLLVDHQGHVLTARHLVTSQGLISLICTNGTRALAKLWGSDERNDIALLRMLHPYPSQLPPYGQSSKLRLGQWVIAVGTSRRPLAVGVISALHRKIVVNHYVKPIPELLSKYFGHCNPCYDSVNRCAPRNFYCVLQHDAPLQKDHLGSPIVNSRGVVVGLNVSNVMRGTSYAVAWSDIQPVLARLKKGEHIPEVPQGFLGVSITEVPEALQDRYSIQGGALILKVFKEYPAFRGGLRANDIILRFNNQAVMAMDHLVIMIQDSAPGSRIKLTILRGGYQRDLYITLTCSPH